MSDMSAQEAAVPPALVQFFLQPSSPLQCLGQRQRLPTAIAYLSIHPISAALIRSSGLGAFQWEKQLAYHTLCAMPGPPFRNRPFPTVGRVTTPLPNKAPRPRPDDTFHTLFLPQQRGQLCRSRLAWEVARRVGVKPLINDPLPVLLQLRLSHCGFRIVRVRAGGDQRAVAQDVGAGLPRGEEDLILEFLARAGPDLSTGLWSRSPLRGGGRIKTAVGRRYEGVEVLRDGVVERTSR